MLVEDHLVPHLVDVQPERDRVAHRSAGKEERGLLASKFRCYFLQAVHRRVFAQLLIANWRRSHVFPHGRRRTGLGIA